MAARIAFIFILCVLIIGTLFCQDLENQIDSLTNDKLKALEQIDSYNKKLEELRLKAINKDLYQTGIPKVEQGDTLIYHRAMMLVYAEQHEQAKWVAHQILPQVQDGGVQRTDNFRPDPKVASQTAVQQDYFQKEVHDGKTIYDGYGYDRGHLAPSADFRWSQVAVSESYFYSNITPQKPEFNRQVWADLEMLLRNYVTGYDAPLTVVSGPVLSDTLPKIERSSNGVSIPEQFFKVAYDQENQRAIAFLMPHRELNNPVSSYAVPIDSVERLTGIDFYHKLPDDLEKKLESSNRIDKWLTGDQKGDVPPIPMDKLGKGRVNTVKARQYIDQNQKVEVCGTVVSTHESEDGNIFLNLDKSFPNTIFSATIWASNVQHFHYNPAKKLMGEQVCLYGEVMEYEGEPSMYIDHEKQIDIERSMPSGIQN